MNLPSEIEIKIDDERSQDSVVICMLSRFHCLFCGNDSVYRKEGNFFVCVSCTAVWYMNFPLPSVVTKYDSDLIFANGLFGFISNLFEENKETNEQPI